MDNLDKLIFTACAATVAVTVAYRWWNSSTELSSQSNPELAQLKVPEVTIAEVADPSVTLVELPFPVIASVEVVVPDVIINDELNRSTGKYDFGECYICLESPQIHKSGPPCGHVFCYECLLSWCKNGINRNIDWICPYCGQIFNEFVHDDVVFKPGSLYQTNRRDVGCLLVLEKEFQLVEVAVPA